MNWKVLLVLLLTPCWLAASNSAGKIEFLNMRLPEARQQAAQLNKPLLVYFTASWCMPCQWMETNTFQNAALIDYTNQNFLAVKVDVDDEEGGYEMGRHNITILPTIMIFNAGGQLLVKQERSIAADRLLELLHQYSVPAKGEGTAAPVAQMNHLSKPALIPTDNTTSQASITQTYAQESAGLGMEIRPSAPTGQGVRTGALPATYYVVQTGAYGEYQYAVQARREAEQKYLLPARILEDAQPNRPTYFKVHLGIFNSEQEATRFTERLQREGKQGFVVKVNNL